MESRQQSNCEINTNSSCESSMLYASFSFPDSKTDLPNFDFETDLRKYLKIKAAFLRSLVHDSGVRNDEKPDISSSIEELQISAEDSSEKPVDDDNLIEEVNQENQNVESDISAFPLSEISHHASHQEASTRCDEIVAGLEIPLPSTPELDDVQVGEDTLPEEPINLHRNTFRWNRLRHRVDVETLPAEQSSSKPCEPSFTEIVMKAFIAGRLMFGALRKRRKLLDRKRQRIADGLFKEEAESSLIAYVDPSALAVDVRPMVPITANTLHKDRSLFNAAERHRAPHQSTIEPRNTPNVGQMNANSSQSKEAQIKKQETNKTSKEIQVKPVRKNKKAASSSSDEDIEELERLSEARLGKRK
ncbi:Hypothetical protein NTJ_12741 [Nesidiocoris tenuis]|uniref:Uncharacterized protein n=1 Tax=Nesidiocoris tenuis TaxID=355587 RepID=A0ABN7B8G8_9HEMI|nr:Hypothetical protein NTJ_12741 [Nesidiocoris tenuis]